VYAEIVARGHGAGARVLLDSYGEALRRGADARPDFLKPNKQEFETTFGGDLRTPRDMAGAAMMLIARGASYAIVSDGPRPFAAAHGGAAWLVTPPAVEPVDPTGSGDTMIAAVLWALSERRPFPECLAIGAAAGAANARAREVARVPRAAIESLIGTVRVERVGA
jgi:tagatose 6-phosphate kinase